MHRYLQRRLGWNFDARYFVRYLLLEILIHHPLAGWFVVVEKVTPTSGIHAGFHGAASVYYYCHGIPQKYDPEYNPVGCSMYSTYRRVSY